MTTILGNVVLVFIFLLSVSMCSDAQFEDYCIADEQYTDDELKGAMTWACNNGADCRAIEAYQPCFFPNTTKDHASYAFNSYYQNMKHNGGSCYFIAASVLTALNPSVSPGTVAVYSKLRVIDKRVRVAELILRSFICAFALISALLIGTDTQIKEIFGMRKEAKFTDMKALLFLVIADGIGAAYSLAQVIRCVVSLMRGSVLFNKPLAWAIFCADQVMAYLSTAAVAAAAQSAAVAKLGQAELQWMKICDMYGKFCNQIGEGVASAVVMNLCMLLLSALSAFTLFRLYGPLNKLTNKFNNGGGGW